MVMTKFKFRAAADLACVGWANSPIVLNPRVLCVKWVPLIPLGCDAGSVRAYGVSHTVLGLKRSCALIRGSFPQCQHVRWTGKITTDVPGWIDPKWNHSTLGTHKVFIKPQRKRILQRYVDATNFFQMPWDQTQSQLVSNLLQSLW